MTGRPDAATAWRRASRAAATSAGPAAHRRVSARQAGSIYPDRFGPGAAFALELQGVDKAFDGRPALAGASFQLAWGEVHALVGENGAGKSTLMNVASGLYAADVGVQLVNGGLVRLAKPAEATAAGIGMVHQHFRLVSRFTVAENVLLALGQRRRHVREAAALVRDKAREVGLPVDPHALVARLSVAERQRAEIIKVLLLGAQIVILDEPTAVLTQAESEMLLSFARRLAREGAAVVLITHKLREVAAHADRLTVMRRGRTVLSRAGAREVSVEEVARLAVGERVRPVASAGLQPGRECLTIRDLVVRAPGGGTPVDGLSLALASSEVLGVAGVGGNGQQELVDALAGLLQPSAGTIAFAGLDLCRLPIRERRRLGLRVVPADRFSSGLVRDLTVGENLALTNLAGRGQEPGQEGGFQHALRRFLLRRGAMRQRAERAIQAFEIHGARPESITRLLSGGNAQKVLLARELDGAVRLLVAHSPARGLDVRAAAAVHALIRRAVAEGAACLLISEDLDEVLELADRVAVINRGRIVGEMPAREVSLDRIGQWMIGHA